MLFDEGIKCKGKEYKKISIASQGSGTMYVFREIKKSRKDFRMLRNQKIWKDFRVSRNCYFWDSQISDIIKKNADDEIEELSPLCKIFQVYGNNGGMKIDSYNNSKHLIPYLKKFIKQNEDLRS